MKTLRILIKKFNRGLERFKNFLNSKFGPSYFGTVFFAKIMASLILPGLIFGYVYDDKLPTPLWIFELFLVFFVGLTLAEWIIKFVIKIFNGIKVIELIAVGLIAYSSYRWINSTFSKGDIAETYLFGTVAIFTIITWIFARSFWAVFVNKKANILTLTLLLLTTASNIVIISFLSSKGYVHKNKDRLLKLNFLSREVLQIQVDREYTAEFVDYGENMPIQTGSVSLTQFANYSGLNKKIRDFYWKRDLSKTPISGRIWYPKELYKAPVLFIIHGNHRMTEHNHLGYDYLGEFLAREGYVTISVNQNMLNGFLFEDVGNENDARAVLLLENIKEILKLNEDKDSQIYNRINGEKIVLAGHSRGGEAAAIATYFNKINKYPDAGHKKFDYDFNIKGVVGISPTSGQYNPAGHEVVIEDVNYLLIHGSHDQDVNTYQGIKQYNNVKFTGEEKYFKSSLYLGYANHGQFNDLWGEWDTGFPGAAFLNRADFLSKSTQQEILSKYLLAFLDTTLKDRDKNLFMRSDLYKGSLPETLYLTQYEDSSFKVINNFEEDSNLETTTMEKGTNDVESMLNWREKLIKYSIGSKDTGNHGVNLKWMSKNGKYSTKINEFPYENVQELKFDIMNLSEDIELLDFTIQLVDSKGETGEVNLLKYKVIYPGIPVGMLKMQHLLKDYEYKHQFQSVIISLDDFKASNSKFNYKNIREINFLFNKNNKGEIIIDNIGFLE